MLNNYYSIAIDGPAGSGKSSVAKELAKQLNFDYVNSGAFYRAIAVYFDKKHINFHNPLLFDLAWLEKSINLKWDGDNIVLNDEDITDVINENKFSQIASIIATYPAIREFVNKNINELSTLRSIVVDGRDIGTVVLPHATAKIFLDADVRTRASRRIKQLKQKKGHSISFSMDNIINELIERDNRDYSREIGPLQKADDAYLLDNSNMTFEETLEHAKKIFIGKVIDESWKK